MTRVPLPVPQRVACHCATRGPASPLLACSVIVVVGVVVVVVAIAVVVVVLVVVCCC